NWAAAITSAVWSVGPGRGRGVRKLGPCNSSYRPFRDPERLATILDRRFRFYEPIRFPGLGRGSRRPPLSLPRDLPDEAARGRPRQANSGGDGERATATSDHL